MADSAYDVLVNIDANINDMFKELDKVSKKMLNLGDDSKKSAGMISQALSFAGGLGITNVLTSIGTKFTEAATMGWDFNAKMQQNLASFKTMLGGSDEAAKKMVGTLTKMASRTPFETTDLTKAATTLMGFGIEADKVEKTLGMLGDASQGNKEKFDSLTLAFAQVSANGKLMGGDVLQMVNAGFNPLKVMSQQTGESMGALRKKMEDGAISSDMLTKAFEAATSKGGLFYGSMDAQSKTFDGQISTLKDNLSLTFGQVMKNLFDDVSNNILPTVITKVGAFQEAFAKTGSVVSAFSITLGLTKDSFGPLNTIIEAVTTTYIPNMKEGFNGFVTNIMPAFRDAMNFITTKVLPPMMKVFEYIYTVIVPKFSEVFKVVMPLVGTIMSNLWLIIKKVLEDIVNAFNIAWPIIRNAVTIAIEIISPLVEGLVKTLSGLVEFVAGVFTGDWGKAWNGVKTIFEGVWDGITGVFKASINGIISVVNSMVTRLNNLKFTIPDWIPGLGGKNFSLDIKEIPAYANGTNYHSGGMALVGEFGPEFVNLPRGSSVTPNNQLGNINVTVGTLVGANGMNEFVDIISNKMNRKYSAAIGGGFY